MEWCGAEVRRRRGNLACGGASREGELPVHRERKLQPSARDARDARGVSSVDAGEGAWPHYCARVTTLIYSRATSRWWANERILSGSHPTRRYSDTHSRSRATPRRCSYRCQTGRRSSSGDVLFPPRFTPSAPEPLDAPRLRARPASFRIFPRAAARARGCSDDSSRTSDVRPRCCLSAVTEPCGPCWVSAKRREGHPRAVSPIHRGIGRTPPQRTEI